MESAANLLDQVNMAVAVDQQQAPQKVEIVDLTTKQENEMNMDQMEKLRNQRGEQHLNTLMSNDPVKIADSVNRIEDDLDDLMGTLDKFKAK